MLSHTVNYTHTKRVRICCHNTDLVHVNGHDRIILVIFSQPLYKGPWWWILCETCWSTFKHFIILILSPYYILCISSIINWLIKRKSCLHLLGKRESLFIPCWRSLLFTIILCFIVGTLWITIPRHVETKLLTGDSRPYSELHWIKVSVHRGSTVVKVLCYKSEGRWFDPS